jgi:FMN reductase
MYAIISCSLNPNSRSARLAQIVYDQMKTENASVSFIDLRNYDLPHCNGIGQSAYDHPQVKELHDLLLPIKGIIIASPIYNWGLASHTKNLLELLATPHKDILTGKVFTKKVVGFIAVGGGNNAFLAPLSFLNSLYIDAQAILVPGYVWAGGVDFNEANEPNEQILKKLQTLATEFQNLTHKLG